MVGALVRAVALSEPDPARTVRSVTAHLMEPALAAVHAIEVEAIRRGSAMSTWRAVLRSADGDVVAELVAIAGAARAFADDVPGPWGVASRPEAPAPDLVPRMPAGAPFPVFTQHLDMRPVAGIPLAGGPAECVGWVGYDEPVAPTAAALLALVDGWWPASLALLPAMPRIATVAFAATLLADPAGVDLDDVLLHHSFVTGALGGYTSEHRRLWSPQGDLLVDNVQTIVVGS